MHQFDMEYYMTNIREVIDQSNPSIYIIELAYLYGVINMPMLYTEIRDIAHISTICELLSGLDGNKRRIYIEMLHDKIGLPIEYYYKHYNSRGGV